MWTNRWLYIIVAVTFITQVYIDPIIRKCKSNVGILLIILHQLLNMTILFGSLLFGHHEYHLLLLVGALVVHKLSGICPLTKVHNKLCDVDESKPLITILNRIVPNYPNNTKNVIMLYYVILTAIISYDIISIIKKYLFK
jgi:hypothetical protein